MWDRRMVLALTIVCFGSTMLSFAQGPRLCTADLVFGKSNVPPSLVPGDLVNVQKIISSRLKANGELIQETRDLYKGLEVVKVNRNPPPQTPGVQVTFRVTEEQANKMDGLMQNAPRLKDKQGTERLFLPLRVQLARARLTGIQGRAEEIVKEGVLKLERISLTDSPDKKVHLQFGKEVKFTLALYIGELLKEPIIEAEGGITSAKKTPVNAVYVLTFFDEKGHLVAASTGNVRGLQQDSARSIHGSMIKGREEDFRSIAKYRFYACVFPSVEPETAQGDGNVVSAVKPKLSSPQEGALLAVPRTPISSWTFRWNPVEGATIYQLHVQRKGVAEPFLNVQVRTTQFSRRALPAFQENEFQGWTWKVRALVKDQWTEWSEERTFSLSSKGNPFKPRPGGPGAPVGATVIPTTIAVPQGAPRAVALSGDGQHVAGLIDISEGNIIRGSHLVVWKAADGKETARSTEKETQTALALSFDGQLLATGSFQHLTVRNVQTGKLIHTFKEFRGNVRQLAFSRAGNLLVSLSSEMGKADVCLWNLQAGKLIAKLPTDDKLPFKSLSLSTDAKTLVIIAPLLGFKSVIQVWDLPAARLRRQVIDDKLWNEHVTITPDGQTIVYSKGLSLQLCDAQTGQPQKTVKESINHFTFSEDGKYLLGLSTNTEGSALYRIHLATGKSTQILVIKHHLAARFSISAQGRLAVLDRGQKDAAVLRLWNLASLLPTETRPPASADPTSLVQLLTPRAGAVLPNGAKNSQELKVWEFSWNPVQGAQEYHLEVRGPTARLALIDQRTRETSFRHASKGYVAPANLRGWRWRVCALVNGVWSEWSEERVFDVAPLPRPQSP